MRLALATLLLSLLAPLTVRADVYADLVGLVTAPAKAETSPASSAFDGILAGMGSASAPSAFDGILAGMGASLAPTTPATGIDAILAVMQPDPTESDDIYDSVADAMILDGSLDFLENILYSTPDRQIFSPGFYRGGGPRFAGTASLPVSGTITSGFGFRRSFGRMHKGVDIRLEVGDTVRAALDGTVVRTGREPRGYGVFVVIQHPEGLETRYAHLSEVLVTAGTQVLSGDPIALGGNTGNSTGPHLHFETRLLGAAFDPTTMFDFSMPPGMLRQRDLAALDAVEDAADTKAHPAAGKRTYVVRTGDTIASVARKAGITTLALCRLNMLSSSDKLQPGRMLRLR